MLNGAHTTWQILNLCLGASGRGQNIYGIYNAESGKVVPVGSLASAKKSMVFTLTCKR